LVEKREIHSEQRRQPSKAAHTHSTMPTDDEADPSKKEKKHKKHKKHKHKKDKHKKHKHKDTAPPAEEPAPAEEAKEEAKEDPLAALDGGLLDVLGNQIIEKNEAQKDPEAAAKAEEERIKKKNLDKFALTMGTNKLAKGMLTKFKLGHENVDDDGKRVELLLVDQITSTSVRLRWTRPKTKYKLHGARIMMREKEVNGVEGIFRAVVDHTHTPEDRVRTVVSLRPDVEYQFQVASIHDLPQKIPKDYPRDGPPLPPRPMIVDGTKATSEIIRTARANYCKAFFFEDPEEARRAWSVFFHARRGVST